MAKKSTFNFEDQESFGLTVLIFGALFSLLFVTFRQFGYMIALAGLIIWLVGKSRKK